MQDEILIGPSTRHAGIIAEWIKTQGDCRGFWFEPHDSNEPLLVIFHSYGHTHSSVFRMLKASRFDSMFCDFTIDKLGQIRVFDCETSNVNLLPSDHQLFHRIAQLLGFPAMRAILPD